ncbi:hypothetical protein E2320_006469 [Naja naja]|nr:hypothetical protein E2320_006469 [Naja naja]
MFPHRSGITGEEIVPRRDEFHWSLPAPPNTPPFLSVPQRVRQNPRPTRVGKASSPVLWRLKSGRRICRGRKKWTLEKKGGRKEGRKKERKKGKKESKKLEEGRKERKRRERKKGGRKERTKGGRRKEGKKNWRKGVREERKRKKEGREEGRKEGRKVEESKERNWKKEGKKEKRERKEGQTPLQPWVNQGPRTTTSFSRGRRLGQGQTGGEGREGGEPQYRLSLGGVCECVGYFGPAPIEAHQFQRLPRIGHGSRVTPKDQNIPASL